MAVKLLTNLACFLAGLIVALAVSSFAGPRLELGIGQTKFHERERCATWAQCGPAAITQDNLISHSYTVGLSDLLPGQAGKTYRFGWRITYANLGEFSGNNLATVHDEDADKVDGTKCDPKTARGCLAWYKGSGRAKGVSFGLTLERNIGPVVVSIEGGPFYFRSSYDVDVFHYQDNLFVPSGNSYEYRHATGSHLTWYAGIRARYGILYFDYRHFHDVYEQGKGPGGDVGLTGGRAWQATAGISIPLKTILGL